MYLEVMTWTEAVITSHAIQGTLSDLKRLSVLIESALASAQSGDTIKIDSHYSKCNEASLLLEVRQDDFDPPSEDEKLG